MSSIVSPIDAFPPVSSDLVDKVRSFLSPFVDSKCSDCDVRRFIRAETKGKHPTPNLELSAKRLEETVAWREKEKPDMRICRLCITDPAQHYMHCIGHDKKGRPVVYSCFSQGPDKEFLSNTGQSMGQSFLIPSHLISYLPSHLADHMLSTFESLVRLMDNQENRWVTLVDFHGFTMRDALNTKIGKAFSHVSGTYYPERLGESFLLDAPSIFSLLWSVISVIVDKKTQEKVRFIPYDSAKIKLREALSTCMDKELVDWIVKETEENRDKAKRKAKSTYDPMKIYELALEGKLVEEGSKAEHCCYGSPALLSLYQRNPSLLLPQCSGK